VAKSEKIKGLKKQVYILNTKNLKAQVLLKWQATGNKKILKKQQKIQLNKKLQKSLSAKNYSKTKKINLK